MTSQMGSLVPQADTGRRPGPGRRRPARADHTERRGWFDPLFTIALLLLAGGATATISIRDSRPIWGYEILSFLAASTAAWRWNRATPRSPSGVGSSAQVETGSGFVPPVILCVLLPLAAIGVWGFAQLALGSTVYRAATLEAALRMASFAATAFASYVAFHDRRAMSEERIVRQHFPRRFFQTTGGSDLLIAALAQFGFFAAMIGVLAYYTSPGKLLWFFPSPYPDTWGFFLSRNNFAQFLELALPAALWRARHGATASIAVAAAMLAAGQASASRAGAVLLIVETVACLLMMRGMMRGSRRLSRSMPDRRSLISTAWKLAAALAMFVTITGVGQLWGRLREADPFQYRREIAHSTMAMIAAHPWRGFGLGTFPAVYPAYAEFDAGAVVDHAHNDWLEWASEGGWPFAAAWGVLAIAVFRPAAQSVWGIGIIVVFLHGLVDYPFARFGVSAWTFLLIGAVTATQRERIASRRLLSR